MSMPPKQQPPLNKSSPFSPSPTPSDKILHLWNKNLNYIPNRNIQALAFKVLQECSSWEPGNSAVQMFFLTPKRNMFPEKFVK